MNFSLQRTNAHLLVFIHNTIDFFQIRIQRQSWRLPRVSMLKWRKATETLLQRLCLPKHNHSAGHHKRDPDVNATIIPAPLCVAV